MTSLIEKADNLLLSASSCKLSLFLENSLGLLGEGLHYLVHNDFFLWIGLLLRLLADGS